MPLKTMRQAMNEFSAGSLHSGKGGPVVKDRKQAIAIGMSAERRAGRGKPPKGGKKRRRHTAREAAEALRAAKE